jgi:hypothetical protein
VNRLEFLGGLGHLAIVYGTLRWLEDCPAIFFLVAFFAFSWINGKLIKA